MSLFDFNGHDVVVASKREMPTLLKQLVDAATVDAT